MLCLDSSSSMLFCCTSQPHDGISCPQGNNQMTGELPVDWWRNRRTDLVKLRHLYINNNQFRGNLTADFFVKIGNGRLQQFVAHDNNFTGTFPGTWLHNSFLQRADIQRAGFEGMDYGFCSQSVFEGGELTSFKSDCAICRCGAPFCRTRFCSF